MTGMPLQVYETTLTMADAAWYETLPRTIGPRGTLVFFAWIGSAGGVLAALPHEWTKPQGSWEFWAIGAALLAANYGIAVLVLTIRSRLRARRRIPRPVSLRVEQWPDRFEITENGAARRMNYEAITKIVRSKWHIFVEAGSDLLILQRRMLGGDDKAEALATWLEAQVASSRPLANRAG